MAVAYKSCIPDNASDAARIRRHTELNNASSALSFPTPLLTS